MKLTLSLLSLTLAISTAVWQQPTLAASRAGQLAQSKTTPAHSAAHPAPAKGEKSQPAAEEKPEKPEVSLTSPELAAACQSFKASASESAWQEVLKSLRALLSQPAGLHADPQSLVKLNPGLNELGVKIIPAGQARIWSFPKVETTETVLLQWTESRAQTVATGKRRKKVVSVPQARLAELTLPQGVVLKDARMLDIPVTGEKTSKPEKGRFLVLAGSKRPGNGLWLNCYRLVASGWHENNEPLSAIPPYLISNLSGQIAFNGSDLVVTITPTPLKEVGHEAANSNGVKLPEPASSNYKLALRLVGGRFALEGSAAEDTPYNAVYQFVHAVEQGHTDLAKAWLTDPGLISIPKYLGLSTKTPDAASRIINMSGTAAGCYRYRLVTFDRYDLICDVARTKQQWAIKALFVAGADPILQKIARSLQAPESKQPAAPAEPGKAGEGKGKEEEKPAGYKPKN